MTHGIHSQTEGTKMSICYVRYHGPVWATLTLDGWTTESIDSNGRARMVKANDPRFAFVSLDDSD